MKNFKTIFPIIVVGILSTLTQLFGQDSTLNEIINNPPEPENFGTKVITPLSSLEFNLSIIVLCFGLIIILLEIYLIKSKTISSEESIKFIVITLIITSTLFLITAGYSNDQIAPAIGLLGTIAGYLLGRFQNSKEN